VVLSQGRVSWLLNQVLSFPATVFLGFRVSLGLAISQWSFEAADCLIFQHTVIASFASLDGTNNERCIAVSFKGIIYAKK